MGLGKETLERCLDVCLEARDRSYSPYSKFRVGAAVLGGSGRVYAGTNVENASFGLTVCAERVAIFNAVTQGEKTIQAVFCATYVEGSPKWCCGACCAVMLEFGEHVQVFAVQPNRVYGEKNIRDLVPFSFGPKDMLPAKL